MQLKFAIMGNSASQHGCLVLQFQERFSALFHKFKHNSDYSANQNHEQPDEAENLSGVFLAAFQLVLKFHLAGMAVHIEEKVLRGLKGAE
jgi:hypothetical protein